MIQPEVGHVGIKDGWGRALYSVLCRICQAVAAGWMATGNASSIDSGHLHADRRYAGRAANLGVSHPVKGDLA